MLHFNIKEFYEYYREYMGLQDDKRISVCLYRNLLLNKIYYYKMIFVRENNILPMSLVDEKNIPSIKLTQKMGFEIVKQEIICCLE